MSLHVVIFYLESLTIQAASSKRRLIMDQKPRFSFIIQSLDKNKLADLIRETEKNAPSFPSVIKAIGNWERGEHMPTNKNPTHYYDFFNKRGVIAFCSKPFFSKIEFSKELIELIQQRDFNSLVTKNLSVLNKQCEDYFASKEEKIEKPKSLPFSAITEMSNKELPYYKDRDTQAFIELHLGVFGKRYPETYAKLTGKILTETIGRQVIKFPCVNLLDDNQELTIESKLNIQQKAQATDNYEAFVSAILAAKPKVTDNVTFAINSFDSATGRLACKVSSYYKALYYCDYNFYQIVANYKKTNYEQEYFLSHWADDLNKILCNDFTTLDLSIGISCLVIHKTPDGTYKAFICKKSQAANGFMDMHVIPSAMYQPIANHPLNYYKELNPLDHVLRELAEEVFNVPEFDSSVHTDYLLTQIHQTPQNADILKLFKSNNAEFKVTGLYLDLYRLRPEILTTIIIHDESWFNDHFSPTTQLGNWEVVKNNVIAVEMNSDFYNHIVTQENGSMCAPGMACYIKGYEYFQKHRH